MSDQQWKDAVGPVVLTQQIIVGAMLTGCLVFLGVVFTVPPFGGEAGPPIMTYVLMAFVLMIVVARLVVPGLVVSRMRQSILDGTWRMPQGQGSSGALADFFQHGGDAARLAMALQVRLIVSVALLEGGAFFGLVVYMVEGSPIALAVAVAMILGVAFHFPTRGRVVGAIEDQLRTLRQERSWRGDS